MTLAQSLFLVALTVVIVVILGFSALVLNSARSNDGGGYISLVLVKRMIRSPRERAEVNRWAFYLHRITGFLVFGFLALHIVDVSLFSFSHSVYNNVHTLYSTPVMRLFECGLVFAVLFHTLNGLRLLVVDLADLSMAAATKALGVVAFLTLGFGVAGCCFVLAPVFS
ncbi:MAG: succinate dehydrogenase, cytochrome b556 subunit [Acidothermaceae bacterium]